MLMLKIGMLFGKLVLWYWVKYCCFGSSMGRVGVLVLSDVV